MLRFITNNNNSSTHFIVQKEKKFRLYVYEKSDEVERKEK